MDWKDVGKAIGSWAPVLGAVLAPVTGGVSVGIGAAVGALTKTLGVSPDAKPEEVMEMLTTDPEVRLKILVAEQEFKLKQREQEIEEFKASLQDIQSARQRQVESEKATGKRDYNLYILAWTIVVGFFVLLTTLMKVVLPPDQNGVIFMLFGALSTGFGQVLQYFFGSSKGSADKMEQMSQLRKGMK